MPQPPAQVVTGWNGLDMHVIRVAGEDGPPKALEGGDRVAFWPRGHL